MKKFWNFFRNDAGERILRLEGPVDEDNFWGDSVTPAAFREELEAEEGDVTVWINSPGGNVFAAAQIYTMLCDHKGQITVKVDAIAASAASVIAMAGDKVLISPIGMFMIHDPMTIAMGNTKDMEKAISTLNEVKASIINAYQKKTGLSRNKISQLMEDETWMNARKAMELGFADGILFTGKDGPEAEGREEEKEDGKEIEAAWKLYSTKAMGRRVLNWLVPSVKEHSGTDEEPVTAECGQADLEQAEERMKAEAAAEATNVKAKPKQGGNDDPDEDSPDGDDPDTDDDPEEDGDKDDDPEEDGGKDDDPDEDNSPQKRQKQPRAQVVQDSSSKIPVIGMDGKTEDGSMPYELLKKQLEFLR